MSTMRGGKKGGSRKGGSRKGGTRKGGAALNAYLAPLALLALRSQLKGKGLMKSMKRRGRRGSRRSRRARR